MKTPSPKKPFALIILDGWGHREASEHNPIQQTTTPTLDTLFAQYPHTLIEASGEAVGLPRGQMGNSEVGHLHLGAGRKVPQNLTRINHSIEQGEFHQNPVLLNALKQAKAHNQAVHIIGLLSAGGVHSLDEHIAAMIKLTHQQGIQHHYCHAILDGRDTPPQSALASIQKIDTLYQTLGSGTIASLIGRYYAMDRDKHWDRTKQAYDLYTQGQATRHANNAEAGLTLAYENDETDEFIKPTSIQSPGSAPIRIKEGDTVIFMNFRADRARQLSYALTQDDFPGFTRKHRPQLANFVTLTNYADELPAQIAFPPLTLQNTLGEVLSTAGCEQLRLAETEKYAHVTYFLNGGIEAPFDGEARELIPSPNVATYDLQPEMSAQALTDKLVAAITDQRYDCIVCNYANPDMVGHTGSEVAAQKAVAVIDQCIKRIIDALHQAGGEALITADHGNIELMFDAATQQPHTAHTNYAVPLLYIGRKAQFNSQAGALDDVAPTLLHLMGIAQPPDMTGHNLIDFT